MRKRWYLLWFVTSGMWLITLGVNLLAGRFDWVVVVQLLNVIVSFAAGMVNRKNCQQDEDEKE
ncbi:MAG: hypothetical protein NC337_05240 [Roseburia sp.]|nr:hypothetical protein [Roseburia sp.]